MSRSIRPRSALLACALLLLATACGGGGGGDLSGEAKVPEGYETFKGAGVSFAYPRGWKVEQRTSSDGGPVVEIVPSDPAATARTPFALVRFSVTPDAGDRFESLLDQRRVVRETQGGEVESDEEVELEGADEAQRSEVTTPKGQGTDPVEVRSSSLEVLRSGGDVLSLVAAAPQRDGVGLDPKAVVSSFRIDGS